MKCPVCRAAYRLPVQTGENIHLSGLDADRRLPCRRCGADLAPLIHLSDQAIWHYCQAVEAFQAGDYDTAIAYNQQAIDLHHHQADFHAFAGQLLALKGELGRAIAAWKIAQQLEPDHPTAETGLRFLREWSSQSYSA
jgi:tetratricopeptide (TPR) repeat protein